MSDLYVGLHLVANIDQDDYVSQAGEVAGLRIVIHPQNKMPFPEDEGFTIEPSHATFVGVRLVSGVLRSIKLNKSCII